MKITANDFWRVIHAYKKLKTISKRLNTIDIQSCNGEIDEKTYERKIETVELKAKEIANELGLISYHQTDPRGCSLYLLDKNTPNDRYTDGTPIC